MKRLIIFTIIISLNFSLKAQPQKYKIYIDSVTGKIYYNKKLPVYFWVSTSPGQKGQNVLLKSEVRKYANPYYWDTEGINTFRVKNPKNKKGLKEAVFDIYADDIPPQVSLKIKGDMIFYGKKIVVGPQTKLIIRGKDYISGFDKAYVSINGQEFVPYSAPLHLNKPGYNVIKYFGVDHVGNQSDTLMKRLYLDMTPPQVRIKPIHSYSDSIFGPNTLVKLIGNDTVAGVKQLYYAIDSNLYLPYYWPLPISKYVRNGHHLLYYYAVDRVGNQSPVYAQEFYIDKQPPDITFRILGDYYKTQNIYYISSNTRIALIGKDNTKIGKMFYTVRGRQFTYDGVIDLSQYSGYTRVYYQAVDIAGNKSVVKMLNLIIDNRAPYVHAVVGKPRFFDRDTLFITSHTPIFLLASDNLAGLKKIEYAINNYDFHKYSKPFYIKHDGFYQINYHAIDRVGNISDVRSLKVYVDNKPPRIDVIFSVEPYDIKIIGHDTLNVYPNNLRVYLAANDQKTGEQALYYSINGSRYIIYSHPLFFSGYKYKLITLKVKSHDRLGNKTEKIVKFVIQKR